MSAGRAANAVNVPVPPPPPGTQLLGEPKLTLTYSGTGSAPSSHVFAQIVDEKRGVVAGNQVTPIPVTLDGRPHTITRSLEGIAISVPAGGAYTLQITGGSQVYGPVRDAAALSFSAIRLEIPVPQSAAVGPAFSPLSATARCASQRRFVLHLRRGWRHARVTVAGKRVKVRRVHGRPQAVVDLRGFGRRTVKVRIAARDAKGHKIRRVRTFHTCGATSAH